VIQSLRRAHRLLFLLWAVLLPVVLAGGLAGRHAGPKPERLEQPGESRGAFFVRSTRESGAASAEVLAGGPVAAPDLLVYWTPQRVGADLPAGARLLGPYRPHRRYSLPVGKGSPGYLSLYSLAHKGVLASLPVEDPR